MNLIKLRGLHFVCIVHAASLAEIMA